MTDSTRSTTAFGRYGWVMLALAIVTLALYRPVIGFDFVNYDDNAYLTDNHMVQRGLTWETLTWAFTTTSVSNWHPLTWLSYLLDVELFGLSPGIFHFENVLWHVLNTVLLWGLLHRMTGAFWRSALVAALFAWHPLHVESVAWISERKDVLSTFFWLLTMWAYTQYVQAKSWRWLAASLGCFALGLMAKPMLVTLPCVLILMDLWPLQRHSLEWTRDSVQRFILVQLREKWPFFALTIGCCAITVIAQMGEAVVSTEALSLAPRLQNAAISYVMYLFNTIWPMRLAAHYEHPQWIPWWQVAGALALLAAAFALAIRQWKTRPWIGIGWLWYLGTLVPVIGVVQVGDQAMADRYTYVPLIGIFVVVAWALGEWAAKSEAARKTCIAASAIMLAACLPLTALQVQTWRNSIVLFEHAIRLRPNDPMPHNNLAVALDDAGRFAEAKAHYEISLQLYGDNVLTLNNLANLLANEGNLTKAVELYLKALSLNPGFARGHFNLALARMSQGNPDEAVKHLREAARLDPNHPNTQFQLAELYSARNQLTEAEQHYRAALQLAPHVDAAENLGMVYLRQAKFAEAKPPLQQALVWKPDSFVARYRLALASFGLKEYPAAAAYLRDVVQLKPDWTAPQMLLARLLSTNPDAAIRNGSEAVRLAERAVQLTQRRDPMALDILAAAHAETGNFPEAIAKQNEALAIARQSNQTNLLSDLTAHLELYQSGKPFRDQR